MRITPDIRLTGRFPISYLQESQGSIRSESITTSKTLTRNGFCRLDLVNSNESKLERFSGCVSDSVGRVQEAGFQ